MRRNEVQDLTENPALNRLQAGLRRLDQPHGSRAFGEPDIGVVLQSRLFRTAMLPSGIGKPFEVRECHPEPVGKVPRGGEPWHRDVAERRKRPKTGIGQHGAMASGQPAGANGGPVECARIEDQVGQPIRRWRIGRVGAFDQLVHQGPERFPRPGAKHRAARRSSADLVHAPELNTAARSPATACVDSLAPLTRNPQTTQRPLQPVMSGITRRGQGPPMVMQRPGCISKHPRVAPKDPDNAKTRPGDRLKRPPPRPDDRERRHPVNRCTEPALHTDESNAARP